MKAKMLTNTWFWQLSDSITSKLFGRIITLRFKMRRGKRRFVGIGWDKASQL